MAEWRVFCIRNKMLKQLYFDCTTDVHSDLRKLEEAVGSNVAHWDFDKHDLICFDLDTFQTEDKARESVAKLTNAAPPPAWQIVKQSHG